MATGTYKQTNNTVPVFGESSPAVLELQKSLNAKGAALDLDSKYGPLTKAAFEKYGNLPTPTNTTNHSDIVSSSAPVVQQEKNITNTVKNLSAPNSTYDAAKVASDNYIKLIDERVKALDERRKSEIDAINNSFDNTRINTENAQKNEKGATNAALFRSGGYLGTSMSGVGVMNNLAQTHRQEIASLEAKRAAAINEANNAITDKQFDLAKLKAQEVKDIEKDIYDRTNKFFEQTIQASQENRLTEASNLKNSIDRVEKIGPTLLASIEDLDETSAREYIFSAAKDLGIDPNLLMGEINGLVAKKAEEETKQVYSLASKYPSAGIIPTDSFTSAQQKIRNSKEYKLDIAKAEYDLMNTKLIIQNKIRDESIDYSDPALSIYAEATGDVVSSPTKARAVAGYADSLLAGKEIVSDDFSGTLRDNQIKETQAKQLLKDAFVQFNKKKDDEVPDSKIWEWLSLPETTALSDEEKKQQIMGQGKNPEDFGIY